MCVYLRSSFFISPSNLLVLYLCVPGACKHYTRTSFFCAPPISLSSLANPLLISDLKPCRGRLLIRHVPALLVGSLVSWSRASATLNVVGAMPACDVSNSV